MLAFLGAGGAGNRSKSGPGAWQEEVSMQLVYEERGGFSGAKCATYARIEATQSAYAANP